MRSQVSLVLAVVCVLASGCKKKSGAEAVVNSAGTIVRASESGPLKVTVALAPEKPRLGDRIQLTLTVEVKPGARVEMPAFGEALGRFAILAFVPREERRSDGTNVYIQRYELDAPMSGNHRIPSLRIQYGTSSDGGVGFEELLTEQLAVTVTSPVTEDQKLELKPLRAPLPEAFGSTRARKWWPIPVLVLLCGGAFYGWRAFRLAAHARTRQSAFDVAIQKIAALEARGLPSGSQADGWYVDLSGIVRRYVEDRFSIRAPELTTEEFFREARRALDLRADHRDLLGAFLMLCDRVKFAAHQPGTGESKEALATARRFLEETRLQMPPTPMQAGRAAS
jgi:hypothetical protein